MNKNQIIEKLQESGIEFNPKATKADLEKLLPVEETQESEESTEEVKKEVEVKEEPKPKAKKIDYKTKLQRTKESLAKQPKVSIIIPKEPSETEGAYATVQINGYMYQIQKGAYVEVPQQVADIIMESRDEIAEAHAKANRTNPEKMEFDNSN